MAPFGYRRAHRHRHQRREARAAALAGVEEERLQAPGRPGLVPGRDRQLRRRPGLPAGDAAAAGACRRRHRRTRPQLPAAAGHRHARRRRPCHADLPPVDGAAGDGYRRAGLGHGDQRHDRVRRPTAPAAAFAKARLHGRRQDRHGAGVHRGAERKYNAKTVAEHLRDHAWFVAFAPAEQPRIAIAVLVENAGFGASTAAPDRAQGDGRLPAGRGRQLKPQFEPSAQAKARLETPPASTPDAPVTAAAQ